MWGAAGQQVGVVRAHTSFLSQRIGPIACLAWAPYDLRLASGGGDTCVAVYAIEAGAAGASGSAPTSPSKTAPSGGNGGI